MKIFIILFLFFISTSNNYSQDYDKIIKNKIMWDKSYLDLKFIIGSGKEFKNRTEINAIFKEDIIPKRSDTASGSTRYEYRIYYYMNKFEPIPLVVEEVKITKRKKSRTDEAEPIPTIDSNFVLTTKDFVKDSNLTQKIKNLINEREYEDKFVKTFAYFGVINSKPEKPLTKNQYYTDFAEIINNHGYQGNASDGYFEIKGPVIPINGSFSFPELEQGLGLNSFGFELGMRKDRVLNLLEFQNPIFTFGIFSSLALSDSFFADVKILPQLKLNTNKIARWGMWPFFRFEPVEINKSPGIIIDAHIWGSFGDLKLPYLNFYYSKGRKNFENPVYRPSNFLESKYVYYSLNQWEASASFYWNADKNNHNKLRFDLGAGGYDVERVFYNEKTEPTAHIGLNRKPNVLPVVEIEYIHSSKNQSDTEIKFGMSARYFDSRMALGAWLKLFTIDDVVEFRIEENYVSKLLGRTEARWENGGSSSIMLFICRYGLN